MAAGSLLARDVVLKAQRLLNDVHGTQWEFDELVDWLNEGQRQICILRPDASSSHIEVNLVPGTKQLTDSATLRVLDVVRNVGDRAITFTERQIMDDFNSSWHLSTPSPIVKHWMYDDRAPTVFYVFPPQPASPGAIEMVVSVSPPDCTLADINGESVDSTIQISDVYESPLINFIVYRSYSKDATYTVRGGKADAAWDKFLQALGFQLSTDKKFGPYANSPPHRYGYRIGRAIITGNTQAFDP